MKNYIILTSLVLISLSMCNMKSEQPVSNPNTKKDPVEKLLAKMTLEEKIGQMNQYSSFFDATGPAPESHHEARRYEEIKNGLVGSMINVRGVENVKAIQKLAVENSRLKIPVLFGFDVIHGLKTIMPIPLAEAASWDMEMIKKSAEVAAAEASAVGINWTFAPMVDISRDPRWGRVMEGAGEDPYLGSEIGVARIKGFQGDDLSSNKTVAACAKHFAGYGFVEAGKEYNNADFGTSTLYNLVLPPFKAAAEAGVATFMNSFNQMNGIPATGDKFLQRNVLKGDWGFPGMVVSDWGSIGEMINHGYAENSKHAGELAVNAGSDMDMESVVYLRHLKDLVIEGKVSKEVIDDAVRRILKLKMDLGLFDNPYKYCDVVHEKKTLENPENSEIALEMAKRSIVLLKNENNLLPLTKTGKKIALIGDLADDKTSPLGNWRLAAEEGTAVSVLEGLNEYTGNQITFEKGPVYTENSPGFANHTKINSTDRTGIEKAVSAAKNADIVLMVLGEHGMQTGEGRSRADLGLQGFQQELLEEVFKVNKHVVLILMNGRPLTIPWAADNIPAIVEAWQLGSTSGEAIASVLYGDYNPSGKLPMTFPRSTGQIPIYYNHRNTGRPGPGWNVLWTQYNDQSNDPVFPFGHGLSYTEFEYSNLKVKTDAANLKVSVELEIKNKGKVAGEEVVQLYLRDRVASVARPIKELKGFKKLNLLPGETQVVQFTLTKKEMGFYNNQGEFVIEPGVFEVMVGGSSVGNLRKDFVLAFPRNEDSKNKN